MRRRALIASLGLVAVVLSAASLAWACVPQADSFSVSPSSGPAGTKATVTGRGFPSGALFEIHWDSKDGPLLASVMGPDFSVPVTIPSAAPGVHYVTAVGTGEHASHGTGSTAFEVIAASGGPPSSGQKPSAPVAAKRAKAIARCKRKYSARKVRTATRKKRMARKRKACIRRAKKLKQ